MIVQHRVAGLASFGDMDWNVWCDQTFGQNADLNQKCKNKPMGPLTAAPWTVVGALQRGIPKLRSGEIVNAVGQVISNATTQPPQTGSVFSSVGGIPKTVLILGGGFLLVGTVAAIASSQGKGGRRRSRRR